MTRRLAGAVSLVVAGIVAVVGTFRPLFWQGSEFRGERTGFTTTSWDITADSGSADIDLMLEQTAQFGVPVVIAAVLLAIAAALVALPEAQRLAARYAAVAGTALLAGSVWTTGMVVASAVDEPEAQSPAEVIGGFTEETGDGIWVLLAAVLLALVGTVFVHGRRAAPSAGGPVVYRVDDDGGDADDTDTPPFGIPVAEVEVARIPETGYDNRSGASGSA